jgi:hypothetical protein
MPGGPRAGNRSCGAGNPDLAVTDVPKVRDDGTITPSGQATLIVAVKDAPKVKDGDGTITRLLLTISEVSVHKAAPNQTITQTDEELSATESGETDTAGWITVLNETQSVDLM